MSDEKTVEEMIAEGDNIGALCKLVEQAGGKMTLHGKPVDADGLRAHVGEVVEAKLEAWATPPEIKAAAAEVVKLDAELAIVNDKLNELYWIYTRCAKGRPPVLVAPELYARRREIEARLREIRRRFTPPQPSARRHAVGDFGDCAEWCLACRENTERGLNPDGTTREA